MLVHYELWVDGDLWCSSNNLDELIKHAQLNYTFDNIGEWKIYKVTYEMIEGVD